MKRIAVIAIAIIAASQCAGARAPALRSVLPPIAPPASITVTSSVPVIFSFTPDLGTPFMDANGIPTNSITFAVDQRQMFFRSMVTNFPLTNVPVLISWNKVSEAASYKIYFGDHQTNWISEKETLNKTQLTTKLWKCWQTNTVAMSALTTNGVESVLSKVIVFKPTFVIRIK